MRKKLYIFGCSGIAKSIVDSVSRSNLIKFNEIIFVDYDKDKVLKEFYNGLHAIHINQLNKKDTEGHLVIFAFYKPSDIYSRKETIQNYMTNFGFIKTTIIDSNAVVSSSAVIGRGVYIAPNVVLDSDCNIGDDTIVLFGSIISREVTLGHNVFISASVVIKGGVLIEGPSFISAGSLITKSIEKNVFINAGVIVNSSVESNTIMGKKSNVLNIKLPDKISSAEKKLKFFHP